MVKSRNFIHKLGKYLLLPLFIAALVSTYSYSAFAADAPIPPRKKLTLDAIQKNIDKAEQHKEKLTKESDVLSQNMKQTQDQLVTLAKKIQANEQNLMHIRTRIRITEAEKSDVEKQIEKSHNSMGSTIQALIRIRRVPPEALLIKPGAPLKTAQTSALLKEIIPAIQAQAKSLSENAERLKRLSLSLHEDKAKLESTKNTLAKERKKIKALLDHRKKLYADVQHEIIISNTTIERLTKEAKSLSDLMQKLEDERKKKAKQQLAKTNKPRRIFNAKIPEPGKPVFPVTGAILTLFGEKDGIGANSKGITIEASPSALVVAPMAGKIQFASYFKNYGQLIIIEHKRGYHSLISGMNKLDVRPGQIIKTGEPLGILPSESSRQRLPTLYYELRHKGQPINPARKFANIKS